MGKGRAIYVHLLMCWSKRNLKYCMLYSVTQRSISFLYSIYIFSTNMPQDESLKKVQSNSISIVAMYDDDDGGEGNAVMRGWHFEHKNALSLVVSVWCGLRCLCELPEVRKYPASITWTVALLELWMFFMTCRLHSLRGKESMLNLAHFSSLRTIDTLYRKSVKFISEVGLWKEGD